MIAERIICLVIGYVFGLFQTAFFYGKAHGIDIREHGSGNSGTTNALRVLGTKAGLIVFAGDCLKCMAAIFLTKLFIARQVAWVHSDASEMPHGFATPFEAAMYLWLVLVMLICAGLQTRKGYVDTNRFGQTENLPVGYFLLVGGLSGAAFALVIAAMRCIAEAQIVPLESVFWLANLATGVFCGATIFAATFAVLCATFFTAKRRRAKLEAELDSPDDI